MFGVTINIINRAHDCEGDLAIYERETKSKVFSRETNAIKWIISTIVDIVDEYVCAFPRKWWAADELLWYNHGSTNQSSYHLDRTNRKTEFIAGVMQYVNSNNLTLDNVIETLHKYWRERLYDSMRHDDNHFHESEIIKFEVDVDVD